ncbi:MAG TPA: SIS domain-containing protein [Candidatus Binatia bacterium]|nr:SIS domain-containing protein [Candidatus Binatia bacterium]
MNQIHSYISGLQETLNNLDREAIAHAVALLQEARLNRRQVFIMGNGGSASTASHFVCDLAKNTRAAGCPDFRVLGLADNMALLSAYANDEGYENVFARQLASFVQPGDLVIAISTSGNSRNVLEAVDLANRLGAVTIGFTGFDGGWLASRVTLDLRVPSHVIEHVEDIHLMLEHLICQNLRQQAQKAVTAEPYLEESVALAS